MIHLYIALYKNIYYKTSKVHPILSTRKDYQLQHVPVYNYPTISHDFCSKLTQIC